MVAWGAKPFRLFGDWSSSGDEKPETLWSLLSNIFNTFLGAEPCQEVTELVLGRMVLRRYTASVTDRFSAGTRAGRAGDFWLILTPLVVTMTQSVPLR